MQVETPIRIIDVVDLMERLGVSQPTAYRKFNLMKKALGKKKHQVVLNKEAADYLGISVADFEQLVLK